MREYLECIIATVRDARWLTSERLLIYGLCFAFATVGVLALGLVCYGASGRIADNGVALGRDFFTFWSGAVEAAAGRPKAAFIIGPGHSFDHTLPYPPITLLLCWPLALLSFFHAYIVWVVVGLTLSIAALMRLVGREMGVVALIGMPAAFPNILVGQSGYYTAALLAWGLMSIGRRPFVAGILFGMSCWKPQLAILIPVALIAGGYWRVLAAAAATALVMALVSTLLLGPATWPAFINRLFIQRHFMESWAQPGMPTIFQMMRLLGTNVLVAYAVQSLSTIAAAISVAVLWRQPCPLAVKAAGLAIAVFLATPYAWVYDTVILVFAAAWLGTEGVRTGFAAWERITVLVLLILPALVLASAKLFGFQAAPILLWLSLAVIMRRGMVDEGMTIAIPPVYPRRPIEQLGAGV